TGLQRPGTCRHARRRGKIGDLTDLPEMPLALSDNQPDLVMRAFAGLDPARPPASCAFAPAAMSAMPTWNQGRMPVCVLLLPSWTKVTFTEGLELDLKTVSRHCEHSAKVTI